MKRENPVIFQVDLGADRADGHFRHAINLQHLLHGQVNGGQIAAGINRLIQGGERGLIAKEGHVKTPRGVRAG